MLDHLHESRVAPDDGTARTKGISPIAAAPCQPKGGGRFQETNGLGCP
jgi:hypothetical protein